ncbi:unnamed protein product [Symbiodinium natans]|uniref:Uncharacterized protein n=1 Tax=Symbiodinium natans TaxID=878477 RepID=A0A812MV38_9DINO|nr:unnamed protein product [Symbiodinium natans]
MLSLSNSVHLAKQEPLPFTNRLDREQPRACSSWTPADLAVAASLAGVFVDFVDRRRARWPRMPRSSASSVRAVGSETSGTDIIQKFETLTATRQLAERSGDQEVVSRIDALLKQEEESNPVAALAWRQQRRLQVACDTVLLGVQDPLPARIQAISVLKDLAAPPLPTPGAEDALFRILREVVGADAAVLRQAADDALWHVWHQTEDEDAAGMMRRGRTLMEGDRISEALQVFSELVKEAPFFAEAWNKRATVYYMLKEFQQSVDDCKKVLELNPRHFGCLSGLGMCYAALGEPETAAHWYKKALSVHPFMQGPRKALDGLEREKYVENYLSPRVQTAVESLTGDAFWPAENPEGIHLEWDVHRINVDRAAKNPNAGANTYFFRALVRNKALGTRQVRSLARFYALRFACGKIYPLRRPTYGQAEFVLEPGEEYKYSWVFTTDTDLIGMVGGMLLERLDRVDASDADRFLFASLGQLSFSEAPMVPMHKVESLNQEHIYMGELTFKASRDS